MTTQADIEKLGGIITSLVVTATKKLSNGQYGSNEAGLVLGASVAKGVDLDAVSAAMYAYAEAFCGRSLGAAVEQVREQAHPDEAADVAEGHAIADALRNVSPETTKKDEPSGEVSHVSIKKFKLTAEPNEKYLLLLYPDIKGKPGEFPAFKYTAARDDMWLMLQSVWDEEWKAPSEKEIDWVAEYQLGREYVVSMGKNAGQTKRYKDLRAIHGA